MSAPRVLALTVAYDGTRYVGWQRQQNGTSIQGLLEDALAPLAGGASPRVVGAGRTDAGVHACGQVASCELVTSLDVESIRRALNARLPEDVRVWAVRDAGVHFHARHSAIGKTYLYYILNAESGHPMLRACAWHVPQPLDVHRMNGAVRAVVGTHDFRAFQAAGSSVSTTRRTLWTAFAEVCDRPVHPWVANGPPGGRLVTVGVAGDGFLRHMVRNLVGTLVEIGLGRRDESSLGDVLASGDRRLAGPTAPAHGLFLMSVDYRNPTGLHPPPLGE
ncbi:MAG: tRNA pseudouridine(38-40) synthase TruA [Vicinamibacterales bacterium]